VNFEFAEIPAFREAKQLLEAGRIGAQRHVSVAWRVENYANKVRLGGWKSERASGGALNLFASHGFYYLEWLLGPIAAISAVLEKAPGTPATATPSTPSCYVPSAACP
jgi:predicted dehydrogenase